jgi:hypothetical protein
MDNPPTVTVTLTFAMYQAALMKGRYEFNQDGDDPIDGILVKKKKDRILIESYPDHLLDLVQTYIDLLDQRIAESASWAAIARISKAMTAWRRS